jgi:mono/diheme cytochrome c family protein
MSFLHKYQPGMNNSMYKKLMIIFFLVGGQSSFAVEEYAKKDQYFTPKSPEESIKTMEVPEGYHLQCVASEPMVQEPVSFAFDEDGALFVCEWRTYMQDEYGKNQLDPISRIVKLVDTDGDGVMDKRTVFVDNIILPRTILPLKDRVLVNLTQTTGVVAYFDDDGDGVSDRNEVVYEGRHNGGNIEHQGSGMVWNLDNYIYTNYKRHKYIDGKMSEEALSTARMSQWGLARDDDGRVYGSWAGGGNPAHSYQLLGGYPIFKAPGEWGPDYHKIFPICKVEDQSSGGYNYEKDHSLTVFSATCGQTMYRGTAMPEHYGHLVTPEPVGRFIRMTKFENKNGVRVAHNAFPENEFIRSTDPFFRPVWSETGPDGCLYFSDMYRGIIQEKTWFPHEGKHHWVKRYKRVKEWGMIKVFRHGRIYRLVPNDREVKPGPKLKNLSSTNLVKHLSSENGWIRDNAQKLIVYNKDKSVAGDLEKVLTGKRGRFLSKNSPPGSIEARLTALWSLEGLGVLNEKTVLAALDDKDERVRVNAIKLSEAFLKQSNKRIETKLKSMVEGASPDVAMQLMLAFNFRINPEYAGTQKKIYEKNPTLPLAKLYMDYEQGLSNKALMGKSSQAGEKVYQSLCITCHDNNGNGVKDPDGKLLAPALQKNRWFMKNRVDIITRILLKGETGAIDGKTYGEGLMLPLEHAYNDEQLADVINYIGQKWNGWKKPVPATDITKIRKDVKDRKKPYDSSELK